MRRYTQIVRVTRKTYGISLRHNKRRQQRRRLSIAALCIPLLIASLFISPAPNTSAAFPYYQRSRVLGSQETLKTDSGGIGSPAVDSQGNIYVAHDGIYIKKFDSSFNYITSWGTPIGAPSRIAGITVDSNDNVWATDFDNNSVYKFSNTGTLLLHIGNANGTGGTGNGQFNGPRDIAVDASGNFFVADTGNHRIQKFNSTGTFQWTTPGTTASSADGQFNNPTRIALSSTGDVYVSDTNNDRIQAISSATGAYILKFGYTGGGLYCPTLSAVKGMTIDTATNTIYASVNGVGCDNIYRFDATGTYLGRFSGMGIRNGIKYQGGNLYSTDGSVSYAGTTYTTVSKINGTTGTVEGTFGSGLNNGDLRGTILAVVEDSNQNTYVADSNQRVTKFDANGNFVSIIADYGTVNPDDLRVVADMAVDTNDNLYVLDSTRRTILKFDSTGAFVQTIGSTGTGNGQFSAAPTALIVTDDGYIFASTATYFNRYTTTGTYLSKVTTSSATTLSGVGEMLTDSSGNVRVLWGASRNRVTTYDSAGTFISRYDIFDATYGLSSTDEFAIDSFDNMYVYDYRSAKVAILKPSPDIAGRLIVQTAWSMNDFMPNFPAKKPNVSTTFAGAFYINPTTNRMYISHRYTDWLEVIEHSELVTPSSAPQNVTATPSGNSLNISWNAPAQDNHGLIRQYKIEYKPDDYGSWLGAKTIASTSTTFQLTNLVADSYQVRISAINDAGESLPSPIATATITSRATFISRQPLPDASFEMTAAAVDSTNGEIYLYNDGTDGSIYVYDGNMNLVRTFSERGSNPGQIGLARDIEFGPDNRVYVADTANDRISIFEKDGTFVANWGVVGTAPGQLTDPIDLTFDTDGTLLVSNEYAAIQRFTVDGTYLEQPAPQVTEAMGSVVDRDGNLYVMNTPYDANGGIYKYDSNGTFVKKFGSIGDQPGQFWEVYDIDITPAGELVFNDTWNARIHFYSTDGTYLETVGFPSWEFDSDGKSYMGITEARETAVLPNGTLYAFNETGGQSILTLQVQAGTTPDPNPTPDPEPNPTPTPTPAPTPTPTPPTPITTSPPQQSTQTPQTPSQPQEESVQTDQPSIPQTISVKAEPSSNTITVSWQAPANIDVKSYLIEYQPLSLSEWKKLRIVAGDIHSTRIELPPGVYSIRISAIPANSLANVVVLGTQRIEVGAPHVATPVQEQQKQPTLFWLCVGLVLVALFIWLLIVLFKKRRRKTA